MLFQVTCCTNKFISIRTVVLLINEPSDTTFDDSGRAIAWAFSTLRIAEVERLDPYPGLLKQFFHAQKRLGTMIAPSIV